MSPHLDFNCCETPLLRNSAVISRSEEQTRAFCRKRGPDWQPSHVIYTWLQVNGVSVADPSHSDLTDLLFLLMSASLVSFFHFFFLISSKPSLSICHLSLERKKKKYVPPSSLLNKSLSLFHSLRLIFAFFFPLTHTHIPSLALASTSPSSLLHTLLSAVLGDQSHDSMVLITGLPFRVRRQESL